MEFEVIENDSRRFKCSVRRVHEMVYDQMGEGICLPCSLATTTTIAYRLKYGILLDFSPQSLINNGICRLQDAIDHMRDSKRGLQEHCDDPFVHVRLGPSLQSGRGYTLKDCKLIWNRREIIDAIKYNFGPWGPKYALLVAVKDKDIKRFTEQDALAAWNGEAYRIEKEDDSDDDKEDDGDDDKEDDGDDDKEDGAQKKSHPKHAMVITGLNTSSLYEDQHVIELRNSHGKGWGGGGHSRVTYDFIRSPLLIPVLKGDVEDTGERHHHLELNTFLCEGKSVKDKCFSYEQCLAADKDEWHAVLINSICFSDDGNVLAAVCMDGSVRILHLHDASSKSFKCKRIYETSQTAMAVAFADNDSSLVVAFRSDALGGTFINTYGKDTSNGGDAGLQFSFKCHSHLSHQNKHPVTLYGSKAYGADESTILATSSIGTDIWGGVRTWEEKPQWLGNPDAIMSADGRYIAAATSDHAVKVWKIKRKKDDSWKSKKRRNDDTFFRELKKCPLKEVKELGPLGGHKDAVTCMCFTPAMEIITASKDGTLRVWNIKGPNAIEPWKTFPLPRQNSKETQLHYDCVAMSPDGDILAVSQGKVLQWLSFGTGKVIDTSEHAHEGIIGSMTWAPKPLCVGGSHVNVLATVGFEKKLKLWKAPALPQPRL